MEIKLDSLVPYEKIKTDPKLIFDTVDKNEKVVLLRDNQPAYIILKYKQGMLPTNICRPEYPQYTLQDAMKIVLLDADDNTMHASEIADEIFNRRLYLQKDGSKAKYNQIRARCDHYPDMFEALPKNIIRLKASVIKLNKLTDEDLKKFVKRLERGWAIYLWEEKKEIINLEMSNEDYLSFERKNKLIGSIFTKELSNMLNIRYKNKDNCMDTELVDMINQDYKEIRLIKFKVNKK